MSQTINGICNCLAELSCQWYVDTGSVCAGPAGSWSAKGAEDMCQPHVHLTVRDKRGKLLEAVQESPQVTSEL